jgi:hypothetical protein
MKTYIEPFAYGPRISGELITTPGFSIIIKGRAILDGATSTFYATFRISDPTASYDLGEGFDKATVAKIGRKTITVKNGETFQRLTHEEFVMLNHRHYKLVRA